MIELLVRNRFPEQVERDVLEWLASDVHRQEKEEVLQEVFREIDIRFGDDTYASLRQVWDRCQFPETARCTKAELETAKNKALTPLPARHLPLHRRTAFRVAAVVVPLLALAGAAWLWFAPTAQPGGSPQVAQVILTVADGDTKEKITLPDSSVVWLRGGSSLRYAGNFTETDLREVYLDGEAFFEVRHTPDDQPFVVQTSHLKVTVLGTEFNVCSEAVQTSVILKSGRVAVDAGGRSQTLAPGDELVYHYLSGEMALSSSPYRFGWWDDSFGGTDLSLREVFLIIEQKYGVTVTVNPEIDTTASYTIDLRADESLENALSVLKKATGPWEYTIDRNQVHITK